MELKEAIQHCREVATAATAQGKCPECAADHMQLADWLEELVRYKATKLKPEEIQEVVDLLEDTIFPCDLPAELKRWADRCTWHVKKCADLDRELQHYRVLDQNGRLVVIPSPDSSENAVLAAVFRGDDPPAVIHGGGDLDDLLALTHLLVSYTAEVCKIGYDELCLGLSTMEPTTGFTPQKEGPEK